MTRLGTALLPMLRSDRQRARGSELGATDLQAIGKGILRFFKQTGEDINAPKERSEWTRSTYEAERKQTQKKLVRVAATHQKRKAQLARATKSNAALKSQLASMTAHAHALERELATTKTQLQMSMQDRAKAPARSAPASSHPVLPRPKPSKKTRPTPRGRVRDEYDEDEDDDEFGYAPNRASLSEATVIETASGTQVGVIALGGGVHLIAEGMESVVGRAPSRSVTRAIEGAASRALAGARLSDWREGL